MKCSECDRDMDFDPEVRSWNCSVCHFTPPRDLLDDLIEAVTDYLGVLNGRGMFDGYGIAGLNKEKIERFEKVRAFLIEYRDNELETQRKDGR